MKKLWFYALALALLTTAFHAPLVSADEHGAALLEERCTGCHPASVTTSREKTPKQWQATVKRMKHKGARLTDAEMKTLVDYLSETFKP